MPPAASPDNSHPFHLLAMHRAGTLAAHRTLTEVLDRADREGRLDPAAPSRLAEWSVGHVLTHPARNADSVTHALQGANAGRLDARYPGGLALERRRVVHADACDISGLFFTDWDDPTGKRHLLRVWVSTPNGRQLPKSFGSFFSCLAAGTVRGDYAPKPSAAANAAKPDTATRGSTS